MGATWGMDADEQAIVSYLEGYGDQWVNAKEICRRAGGKGRFSEDPSWARPILLRLKELRLVEADLFGRFRLPQAKEEHGADAKPEGTPGEGEIPEGTDGEIDE